MAGQGRREREELRNINKLVFYVFNYSMRTLISEAMYIEDMTR
jgi:hypothetical protein